MKELLRSNNLVEISYLTSMLKSEGIEVHILDNNMSIIHRSVFGTDIDSARTHYFASGVTEGRTFDGFDEILVCTSYTIDGEKFDYLPASQDLQAKAIPIYETLSGWETKTVGARTWGELPAQAIKYVRRIEELIEAPVALLSTSPERQDTILVHDPFSD